MLVNHPNMETRELPPHLATWSTMPQAWGQLLTDRMGVPMFYSNNHMHWYAKLQGRPIHIRRSKKYNTFEIEHSCSRGEIRLLIQEELANGIIITQVPNPS